MSMAEDPHSCVGNEPSLTVVTMTSHCDWAWTHSRAWHEARYAEMIHRYLLIMRDHPHYVCEMETVNEQLLPFLTWAEQRCPELIEEFWQRVDQGRIVMTVGYSNPRISEVYPETLIRNLILGKAIYQQHAPNSRQVLYNAVDVMAGSGQMPQMLTQAGYRYFVFQRAGAEQVVFRWLGLDGTSILTARSMSVAGSLDQPPSVHGYGATVKGIRPLPIWRVGLGMDDAMPSPAIAEQAADWDPQTMILATTRRYLEACETCGVVVSEVTGPLDSLSYYANAGLHGNHNLYTRTNCNEDLLLAVEKAESMAAMLGRSCWIESIDALWRDLLSCTGHAMLWIWEADYEERLAKAADTRARGRRALEEALSAITCGIAFDRDMGTPLVVFNVHDRPTSGPVEFRVDADPAGLVLRDRHGIEIPLQSIGIDADGERRLAFVAERVPACGYRTLYLDRQTPSTTATCPETIRERGPIENNHYRIDLRSDGRLEIFDKALNRILGESTAEGLADLVVYDLPPSNDWTHNGPTGRRRDLKVDWSTCQVVRGPVVSSLRVSGTIGPHHLTREVRLWAGHRRIEFLVEVDGGEDNGVLCIRFPMGLAGRVVAGVPFGVEPRDDTDHELARGEAFSAGYPEGYYGTRWTDVSTPEWGYTFVCPPGVHTGYAFRRAEKALEFTLLRFRPMPADVFRRAHPTLQGRGRHRWSCALVPHQGDWCQAESTRWALEQHVPLLVHSPWFGIDRAGVTDDRELSRRTAPADMAGTLRLEQDAAEGAQEASLAEVSPTHVVLSTMRRLPPSGEGHSRDLEVRLYENAGQASDVVLRLGIQICQVRQTNLLGEPLDETGPIDVAGHDIRFRIQPWKIVTLRVTQADEQTPRGLS